MQKTFHPRAPRRQDAKVLQARGRAPARIFYGPCLILKGLEHSALGCESARSVRGKFPSTLKGLQHDRSRLRRRPPARALQPFQGWTSLGPRSQGSSRNPGLSDGIPLGFKDEGRTLWVITRPEGPAPARIFYGPCSILKGLEHSAMGCESASCPGSVLSDGIPLGFKDDGRTLWVITRPEDRAPARIFYGPCSILKGLEHSALGCESARSVRGKFPSTLKGLQHDRSRLRRRPPARALQPFQGWTSLGPRSQGSSRNPGLSDGIPLGFRDDRRPVPREAELFRPGGACPALRPNPALKTLGYFRPSLRDLVRVPGCASTALHPGFRVGQETSP